MKLTPAWRNRLQNLTTIFLVLTVVAIIYTLIQWNRSEFGSFEPLNALFLAVFPVLSWFSKLLSHPDNVQPPASSEIALAETPAFGPLRQQITNLFSLEELRVLCLDVGIRYDALSGDTIDTKAASLLAYADRRGQLNKLIAALQQERPQAKWPVPNTLQTLYDLRRNVRATWIDGVLKQSVTDEIALELNLMLEPHALTRKVAYVPGQAEKPIEKEVSQLFADFGSLLILGEPGSGKTMTLLQLAENLLNNADRDATLLTPVILNLSSWANERKSLGGWMVEELWQQYQLPREAGQAVIQSNQLIYLLDGLDEVAEAARDACVRSINLFREENSCRLAVCCRAEEYEALPYKLNLGRGLRIQPLSKAQVEVYLQQPELELAVFYKLWQTDEALQKLAQTPLFLSVITLAYQGINQDEINHLDTKTAWQNHLYFRYVDEMFRRRPVLKDCNYDEREAITHLINLASGMEKHEQTIFYIESLQPTWLPSNRSISRYIWLNNMIYGLLLGMLSMLSSGFYFMSDNFIIPPGFTLSERFLMSSILGVVVAIFIGPILGLIFGLVLIILKRIGGQKNDSIELVQAINLKFPSQKILLKSFVQALFMVGLSWLFFPVVNRSLFFLAGVLSLSLFVVLETFIQVPKRLDIPRANAGTHNSLRNGLSMVFPSVTLYALASLMISWIFKLATLAEIFKLGPGFSMLAVFLVLRYGGHTFVKHYTLRWVMARNNIFSFAIKKDHEFIDFLDAMKERILLRRVGGGWVFIHRTLLEYFASLHPNAQVEVENV